jgi:AcrR family transcriptional regulator
MGSYSTGERTRLALIHAAGELVAERGMGLVSTRAIATKAGENLGAIHYHFGGKEGLFKEMIRFACHSQEGPSLQEVLGSFEGRLDGVEGQAEAVRKVMRWFVQETFSPDRPRWCSRVMYQMAQHEGPLRDFLRKEMLDPFFDAMQGFFHRIRPDLSDTDLNLLIYMFVGPIVFHSDHNEIVHDRLAPDSDVIPANYLARLEERMVADTLRALGLPLDANAATADPSLPASAKND